MKKLIVLVVLLILMAVTNPSKIEYVDWAKEKLKEQSKYELVDWGIEFLAPNILEGSTKANDYLIFSIFETEVMGVKVKTVGICKNFILLPNENNK